TYRWFHPSLSEQKTIFPSSANFNESAARGGSESFISLPLCQISLASAVPALASQMAHGRGRRGINARWFSVPPLRRNTNCLPSGDHLGAESRSKPGAT